MKVVLVEPEIPQNTGNVVRTCAVTGFGLVLVEPLGFSINDRWLKRAGLDYWEGVEVEVIDDLVGYLEQSNKPFTFFSSNTEKLYTEKQYDGEELLIFGSETKGLSPVFWEKWPEKFVTLPMKKGVRCLNLATSVGIGVYEAWRQKDFLLG